MSRLDHDANFAGQKGALLCRTFGFPDASPLLFPPVSNAFSLLRFLLKCAKRPSMTDGGGGNGERFIFQKVIPSFSDRFSLIFTASNRGLQVTKLLLLLLVVLLVVGLGVRPRLKKEEGKGETFLGCQKGRKERVLIQMRL